jgi:hypothetical protein
LLIGARGDPYLRVGVLSYGGERTGVGGFTRNLTDKLLMADHLDFNQFEKQKRRKNSHLRDRHHLVSLKPRWLASLNVRVSVAVEKRGDREKGDQVGRLFLRLESELQRVSSSRNSS